MNEVDTNNETQTKSRPNLNLVLIVGAVVALVAGGLFILPQISSSLDCAGEGACMLYFYTDW